MQKFLRILVILLLLFIVGGIVYSQTELFTSRPQHQEEKHVTKAQQAVADLAAKKPDPESVPGGPSVAISFPPGGSSASSVPTGLGSGGLGTENSPLTVKIVPRAPSADEVEEHHKDRDILLAIAHNTSRLAAAAMAQNFLLIFQAVIYFLTLLILFKLLESVRKFADAAGKSAEAAKKSAEAAAEAAQHAAKPAAVSKFPPRYARRR